jgi:hypothetical protein
MTTRTLIALALVAVASNASFGNVALGVGVGEIVTVPELARGGLTFDATAVAVIGTGRWIVLPGLGGTFTPEHSGTRRRLGLPRRS